MDTNAVESSYARWAPIYDRTFGALTGSARRNAVDYINRRPGSVLEIGVGTGLALPHYRTDLDVTGIDYSEDMLCKARDKVDRMKLTHVRELRQMDARTIDYPDAHFDTVAAMHVLSVVPDPETVMAEVARVCKPGGEVVVVNHFKRTTGVLALLERGFAPFANVLGWHSDFSDEMILKEPSLSPVERRPMPPFGMMTFMTLRKAA